MNSQFANLKVELDSAPGSLERLLCTLRRRGFDVKFLLVDQIEEGFSINAQLENLPFGSPSFENLECHLNNQLSISKVALLPAEAASDSPKITENHPVLRRFSIEQEATYA